MASDPIPASSASDGRWKIASVPTGSNPLSVAILNGGTSKALTYSFTDTGFNFTVDQATITDKRLTLDTDLSRAGKKTESGTLQYVDSADADSAAVLLTEGSEGQFVVRKGISNATAWTVGQKVDVYTYQVGAQRPDAPTENGIDYISQGVYLTKPTVRKAVLVA